MVTTRSHVHRALLPRAVPLHTIMRADAQGVRAEVVATWLSGGGDAWMSGGGAHMVARGGAIFFFVKAGAIFFFVKAGAIFF